MLIRNGISFFFAAVATLAYGQQGQVAGPVAGYVFDAGARAMRPVLGIPGASILGDALQFGFAVSSVNISPANDAAVAVASDGSVHLFRLNAGAATEVALNGATIRPERVVFSPTGSAVALIAPGRALVFTGLPASATLSASMDLPANVSPALQAQAAARRPRLSAAHSIALSDDGAWLLAVAGKEVQLIGAGGSHAVGPAGASAHLAFAPGTHEAAIADPAAGRLVLLRDVPGAATRQPLSPITGVTGLAFSPDAKSLFVASNSGPVTILDLASGNATPVSCNCTATGLDRMGNVYRLNEPGSGPLWLLDPVSANPRIVFVPALPAAAQSSQP
jgi:hypothetical protein